MADSLAQDFDRDIPLSEMIQTLRMELQAAMHAGRDEELRLKVKNVELELKLAVERERQASGGIKFWVVEAEGRGRASERTTHTFKLTLEPVTEAGGGFYSSDESSKPPR